MLQVGFAEINYIVVGIFSFEVLSKIMIFGSLGVASSHVVHLKAL